MRVGVIGAGGRMGAEACRALEGAPEVELVAAIHPRHAGRNLAEVAATSTELVIAGDLEALKTAGVEVVVDFSTPTAATAALFYCAANHIHAVSGTTGIAPYDLERLRAAFEAEGSPNAVLAPNFAVSAVVLIHLAALAAPYFEMAEIIELHHEQKRDSPSGTALETARHLAASRAAAGVGEFARGATDIEVLHGARGASGPAGVRLHAVRLRGLVAHEEVIFGALGQTLTLRQDTFDRSAFMPGLLLALARVATTSGFTLGLDTLLGL